MQKSLNFSILTLLLCCSLNTHAQLAIGPKVGINIANWSGDAAAEFPDRTSVLGWQFGVAAEITVNDRVAIQPEILYFQKGIGFESEDFGGNFSSITHLNYLEIPILGKVRLTNGNTQIFVSFGPSFGFGLDGKIVTEFDNEKEEMDIDFEEEGVNGFDFSASLGAGIQMPAGPGKLFIDARYLLGFSGLDVNEPEEERIDVKNRGIGIAAGFLFLIGG